jgi:hypothetical protein
MGSGGIDCLNIPEKINIAFGMEKRLDGAR